MARARTSAALVDDRVYSVVDRVTGYSKRNLTRAQVRAALQQYQEDLASGWRGGPLRVYYRDGSDVTKEFVVANRSRRNAHRAPIDYAAAGELKLYIDNDGRLYEMGRMYRAALAKRMQKGTFNLALAAKGFGWIVEEGAKKYTKEFGGTWHSMFSPATREVVAKEMAQEWYEEYRAEHGIKANRRRASRRNAGKLIRFPEGVMTEAEWVARHADRLERFQPTWETFYDRGKFNRLERGQDEYIASLKKKAEKPLYFAYKGDVNYQISKSTYDAAPARLKAPKANRRRTSRRNTGRPSIDLPQGFRLERYNEYGALILLPGPRARDQNSQLVSFYPSGGIALDRPEAVPEAVKKKLRSLAAKGVRPNPRRRRTSRRARRTSRRAA